MDPTLRTELALHNWRQDKLAPSEAGKEIRGGQVRLQGKSMLTHTKARAEEEANVRDFYQNLVRDLQRDLNRSLGPIRSSGHKDTSDFTKQLEKFAEDLDKHVENFGKMSVTGDKKASAAADEIMDSKPVSVNAPDSLKPRLTPEQDKQLAEADRSRQGTPQGGDGTPRPLVTGVTAPAPSTVAQPKEEAKK